MTGIKEHRSSLANTSSGEEDESCLKFVEEMVAREKRRDPSFPSIVLSKIGHGSHSKDQAVDIRVVDSHVDIAAGRGLSGAAASAQFAVAHRAGHHAEWIGSHTAQFTDRWLWLGGRCVVTVGEGLRVVIPEVLKEELEAPGNGVDALCQRVIQLGWNGILFGARADCAVEETLEGLRNLGPLIARFHKHGLRVGIRPTVVRLAKSPVSTCPVNTDYHEHVVTALRSWLWSPAVSDSERPDTLLWESRCRSSQFSTDPSADGLLYHDLLTAELGMVEAAAACRINVTFLVPWRQQLPEGRQIDAMMRLCQHASKGTSIAYSGVSNGGSATGGDNGVGRLHPLWNQLREYGHVPATKLLPVVNVGGVGQGEGLWPCSYLSELEACLPLMAASPCSGAIAVTNTVPELDAMLGGSLWAAGCALNTGRAASVFFDTWRRAYRSSWSDRECEVVAVATRLASRASLALAKVEGDALRDLAETLFSESRYLKRMSEGGDPELQALVTPFVRDVRRMIMGAAQTKGLSLGNVATSDDSGFGFWTAMRQGAEGGVASGGNVMVLSEPRSADESESVLVEAQRKNRCREM